MLSTFTPPSISRRIGRPRGIDPPARLGELAQRRRNELLAAEAGIHRHDQHQVELLERVVEIVQRRRRIEHQAGLAAVLADQRDGAVDVLGRLRMEADVRGAGRGEIRHDAIDRLHHQVHVDRRRHAVLAQRLAHQRADRQVRARNGCPSRRSARCRRRRAAPRPPPRPGARSRRTESRVRSRVSAYQPRSYAGRVSRARASRYFALVRAMISAGSFGPGRLLVPVERLEVVAHELLVEARRAGAGPVGSRPARSARNPVSALHR